MIVRPFGKIAVLTDKIISEPNRLDSFTNSFEPVLGVFRDEASNIVILIGKSNKRVVTVTHSFKHDAMGPSATTIKTTRQALTTWESTCRADVWFTAKHQKR